MQHFVTNFNLRFLPQGLALYRSMERHIKGFTLWVVCMDQACFNALEKLNLPFLHPINFTEHETESYQLLRSQRSIAEYCWTINPLNPFLVFSADTSVEQVTYLDADMWFLNSPNVFFEEFSTSQKSVMLTEHAYLSQYDQSNTSGQFCAQWITYCRDKSEPLRQWWQERCYEWCFNRYENGKFGDQKYLEQWPILFPDRVYVLSHSERILAPWNAEDSIAASAIAHHFHGLRVLDQSHYCTKASYQISEKYEREIYQPYLQDLRQSIRDMMLIGIAFESQLGKSWNDKSPMVQAFLMQQMAKSTHLRIKSFCFNEIQ